MNEKGTAIEQLDWMMEQMKDMDKKQPSVVHELLVYVEGVPYFVTAKGWGEVIK